MLTPLEIKKLKDNARKQGVTIFSIWTNAQYESRKPSSIREYICYSTLKRKEAIISILVYFFKEQGYTGKVKIIPSSETYYYRILLTNRLQQRETI